MKRILMWLIAKRELKNITEDGLYFIQKSQTGSYYIVRIRKHQGHWKRKDIVRISDHYPKNSNGNTKKMISSKNRVKHIIVHSIFNIETIGGIK